MRLVLDTNVIISAFINSQGKPAQIVSMILNRKADLCYNAAILSEYESVALRPKFTDTINFHSISRFIAIIRVIGVPVLPIASAIPLPDESDRIFYDTARESDALLITGNTKHFPSERFIITPGEFLFHYGRNQ